MSDCWIQTRSGKRVDLISPSPEDILITDIADSLSMKCRFGGHTKFFYSVAEHSIYVSVLLEKRLALAGLLHDASEAYLVDMSRPLKNIIPEYRTVESMFEYMIYEKYGCLPLSLADLKAIKKADNIMLATEARDLMGDTEGWNLSEPPLETRLVVPVSISEAREKFLNLFHNWQEIKERVGK